MASRHVRYDEIVKAFGKAVKGFRSRNGYSQEGLADKAKLDRSYMSQIERGIKNATLNSLWTISTALDIKPSELLYATEKILGSELPEESEGLNVPQETTHAAPSPRKKILVVDDDPDICSAIGSILLDSGFEIDLVESGMAAIHFISTYPVDAIVTDIRMSHGNGLELLQLVKRYFPQIPVFFITGYDDISEGEAIDKGASGLFNKPFDLGQFVSTLKASLQPVPQEMPTAPPSLNH